MKKIITLVTSLAISVAASAQYNQQSPKLMASGLPSGAQFGEVVSLSADASTAIVGAWGGTNGDQGQAIILNRDANNIWHQGQTLIGTGAIGGANQGSSVAISADGNTAIVGGPLDNSGVGAAWIFTKTGNTWTEQAKITPNDNTGASWFGYSVSVSGDGNTVAVGGPLDNTNTTQQSYVGPAWMFKRSGNTWSQQGTKLLISGVIGINGMQGFSIALNNAGDRVAVGAPGGRNPGGYGVGGVGIYGLSSGSWIQETYTYATGGYFGMGASVALSANGERAIVGQPGASGGGAGVGQAIIMERSSSGTWAATHAVSGLLPVGASQQGESVDISDDGKTIVVGGASSFYTSQPTVGATWVFTYNGSTWNQEGNKYVGTGAAGNSQQGHAVAMSADGNTFITGGFGDDNKNGAVWVFSKTIPPVTTNVNDLSSVKVEIYPNPAQSIININSSEKLINELFAMDGKVVLSKNTNTSLDISSLPVGIYLMNLYNKDGVKIKVEKIVKN